MAKIACIGAGTVGRAWAAVFARGGYDVALYDALDGQVTERALPSARETLELLASGGLLDEPRIGHSPQPARLPMIGA